MNSYYHAFQIGFNFYYIWAVISVLISVGIGLCQFQVKRGRIRKLFSNKVFILFSALTSLVFAILFVKESTRGMIQFLDNGLTASESPMWSIFVLPVIIIIVVIAFGAIIYYVGRFTACYKLAVLKDKRRH